MKAICMPVFNRPELLRQALDSICENKATDWRVYLSVDWSYKSKEIDQIIRDYHFKGVQFVVWGNGTNLGCSLNAFTVCSTAISQGAEAILYMEDDIVLSPDALALCDWYLNQLNDPNDYHAGIALCRREGNVIGRPEAIEHNSSSQGLLGQSWCFTRKQWFDFALGHWWSLPDRGHPDIWDWALGWKAQQLGKSIMRPYLSRARHIGATGFHGKVDVFPDVISDGTHRNYFVA